MPTTSTVPADKDGEEENEKTTKDGWFSFVNLF